MSDLALREHLLFLLGGGNAHLSFGEAIAELPPECRAASVKGVPHTVWRLLEHMRICQWDILEFSRDPQHTSPKFPDGYWPESDGPEDQSAWDASVCRFEEELQQMMDLIADPGTDLYARIPHGDGQTVLREALLLADHNAYHLGQIVMLRRCLSCWPET